MAAVKPTHILLFRSDYERIKDWVLQYPRHETGGQFFGLWTYSKAPYITIVIGPGKDCRHETHSFHQDINYLREVGEHLNKEFMVCHIGEWHSHHRLRLRQPSSGDLNSIWNHFPEGVEYFLLVIATIEREGNSSAETVKLWPWIFSSSARTHEGIEVKFIEKENVYMKDGAISRTIANGAERTVVALGADKKVAERKVVHKTPWWESETGTALVQYLNSELEKLADNENIEITSPTSLQALELSFRRCRYNYIIHFPHDFLQGSAVVTCKHPQRSQPIKWEERMCGRTTEQFVQSVIRGVTTYVDKP